MDKGSFSGINVVDKIIELVILIKWFYCTKVLYKQIFAFISLKRLIKHSDSLF